MSASVSPEQSPIYKYKRLGSWEGGGEGESWEGVYQKESSRRS